MFHNEICHGGQLQILSNVTHLRISISCFMYVSCFKIYITQVLCMYPPYVCWACSVHYNACVKDTPHIHEPRTKLHEAVLHNVPYWNESCWTTAHPIRQKDVCWLGDALGQNKRGQQDRKLAHKLLLPWPTSVTAGYTDLSCFPFLMEHYGERGTAVHYGPWRAGIFSLGSKCWIDHWPEPQTMNSGSYTCCCNAGPGNTTWDWLGHQS